MKDKLSLLLFVFSIASFTVQGQPTRQLAGDVLHGSNSQAEVSPVFIAEHPDDVFWDDQFTLGSIDGRFVTSMVFDEDNNLYVGGYFTTAGKEIADLVAKWDGTSWSGLGGGLFPNNPPGNGGRGVSSMVIDKNGTLYATGYDISEKYWQDDFLVKFEGDVWTSIGREWGTLAWAVAIDKEDNLYVSGYVGQGNPLSHVIKWDGTSWSDLGEGLNDDPSELVVDGAGNVYAAGRFDSSGTTATNRIAKWDGVSWTSLGKGIDGIHVSVLAIDSNDNLYVGGLFDTAGGMPVSNIAKWDGVSWSSLGEGLNGHVWNLAVNDEGELFAAGGFDGSGDKALNFIAKWDGVSWEPVGNSASGDVSALAVDNDGVLHAGGRFRISAGAPVTGGVIKWDGNQWSALTESAGSGVNGSVESIVNDEKGILYVGGSFTTAGDITANNIARWDGVVWSSLGEGLNGRVTALALGENNDLYAVGDFDSTGSMAARRVAKWNGDEWSSLAEGLSGWVSALALDRSGNLYAGGSIDTAGVVAVNGVAKWDGVAWSALGEGLGDDSYGNVSALAVDASDNLFVGGGFERAGGEPALNIAMWDGNTWSGVSGGLSDSHTGGHVNALTFDAEGNLYAGGNFSSAGGKPVANIARWIGDQWGWGGIGIGFNTTVFAIETNENGDVYAGGQFNALGPSGFPGGYNRISRWNGNDWVQLGSGMERSPRALAIDGQGYLYAGGYFSLAGNKPSVGIARWDIEKAALATSVDPLTEHELSNRFTPAFPNPFRKQTVLEMKVTEPQYVVISVYDVSGKMIRQLFDGQTQPQQIHTIQLDGTGLTSGTYFIRAQGERFTESRTVTYIK